MKRKIVAHTALQKKYVYFLTEPIGTHFAPDFKPDMTPKEMLELGIFGGKYWGDIPKEFPKSWFTKAKIAIGPTDKKLNYFGVFASQPLKEWQRKGWIYADDPHGWFEWYCRYYMGRRLPVEDMRQIKRWKNITRHVVQVSRNCKVGDIFCRPRQRQAVLHWSYDSRKI